MPVIETTWNGRRYRSRAPIATDLAIPLAFDGRGPRAFGAQAAAATPLVAPGFSARVAKGASCNASILHMAPHANGTHTETVAHLCDSGPDAPSLLAGGWMPAWLASLKAEAGGAIPAPALRAALANARAAGAAALIVRTLPNGLAKLNRHYGAENPAAWFSEEAARAAAAAGIEHLLVDLPSLDRTDDPELRAHRAFFGLPAGSHELREAARRGATVTEMIFAAGELADGLYLLELQMPRWRLEAVPSRPLVLPAQQPEKSA